MNCTRLSWLTAWYRVSMRGCALQPNIVAKTSKNKPAVPRIPKRLLIVFPSMATKSLSVNNMLHCFPVGARVRVTEKSIAEGQTGLVGSIGCVLGESRTARTRATGTREQKEIPAQAGRWPQTEG